MTAFTPNAVGNVVALTLAASPASITIDWGDGQSETIQNPQLAAANHLYIESGLQTIKVTDGGGASTTQTIQTAYPPTESSKREAHEPHTEPHQAFELWYDGEPVYYDDEPVDYGALEVMIISDSAILTTKLKPKDEQSTITELDLFLLRTGVLSADPILRVTGPSGATSSAKAAIDRHAITPISPNTTLVPIRITLAHPIIMAANAQYTLEIDLRNCGLDSDNTIQIATEAEALSSDRTKINRSGAISTAPDRIIAWTYPQREWIFYVELDINRRGDFSGIGSQLGDRVLASRHSLGTFSADNRLLDSLNLIAQPATWRLNICAATLFSAKNKSSIYSGKTVGAMIRLLKGNIQLTAGWIFEIQPDTRRGGFNTTILIEDQADQLQLKSIRPPFLREISTGDYIDAVLNKSKLEHPYAPNRVDYSLLDHNAKLGGANSSAYAGGRAFQRLIWTQNPIQEDADTSQISPYQAIQEAMTHEASGLFYTDRRGQYALMGHYSAYTKASEATYPSDCILSQVNRQKRIRNRQAVSFEPKQAMREKPVYELAEAIALPPNEWTEIQGSYIDPVNPEATAAAENIQSPIPGIHFRAYEILFDPTGFDPDNWDPADYDLSKFDPTYYDPDNPDPTKHLFGVVVSDDYSKELKCQWTFLRLSFTLRIFHLHTDELHLMYLSPIGDIMRSDDRETVRRASHSSIYKHGDLTANENYDKFIRDAQQARHINDLRLYHSANVTEYTEQITLNADITPGALNHEIGDVITVNNAATNAAEDYVIVGEAHQISPPAQATGLNRQPPHQITFALRPKNFTPSGQNLFTIGTSRLDGPDIIIF